MSLVQIPVKTQPSPFHGRSPCELKSHSEDSGSNTGPRLWLLGATPFSPLPARSSGLSQWYILELSLSRDHPVSCWNWFSVQLSFPIVHSFGVRAALSDKSRAFSFGDSPGFSSAECLYKRTAKQRSKVSAWPNSGCTACLSSRGRTQGSSTWAGVPGHPVTCPVS